MGNEFDRFDDAFREWANRPPGRTGAEAALEVRTAIRSKQRRTVLRWSGLAAAAAVVIAVSAGILRQPEMPPTIVAAAGTIQTEGLADGVVLMWLDDETPLYMTFQGQEGQISERGATP